MCDYTDQGMAARQRALDRGYRGSRPPQPRDQSLHSTNKRRYFQYAVRSTQIAALQSLTTTSNTRTLDVTVTGWDNKDRTVTVQPYHSRPGDVQTTLHLDHPFNVNPKWKLRAGPWLTGSIICDQWTPDPSGCVHPPYRGKVLAWDASQVNKAKIEYFDHANDTTMQDLDDSTTHSHWRLLQTKHHLETKPHHGFKDMDQMRI